MQTKKVLKAENGDELVYIKLSYPVFENGILKKSANDFYKKLADNFEVFASNKLLAKAADAKSESDFKPFSAVMMYDTEENNDRIKVTVRTFVYDGHARLDGKVTFQYWNKKTGLVNRK